MCVMYVMYVGMHKIKESHEIITNFSAKKQLYIYIVTKTKNQKVVFDEHIC